MLSSKTVFIVGAGASSEVKLPVGNQLKADIVAKLQFREDDFGRLIAGDMTIASALRQQRSASLKSYSEACVRICGGLVLSSSIDDFIDAHRDDEYVGRAGRIAIAYSILQAERDSALYFERKRIDSTINFNAIQDTWYAQFYSWLTQGVSRSELPGLFKNVSIVTFNYDRCIEHFLVHAIAANYNVPIVVSTQLVAALPIHRPYGSVGNYFGDSTTSVEFGSIKNHSLDRIEADLKTYTQKIEDPKSLSAIRTAISEAHVLVFLGNAFHATNMRVLGERNGASAPKRIFATRKGISDADLFVVKQQFLALCGNSQIFADDPNFFFSNESEKCSALFNRFRLSLRS